METAKRILIKDNVGELILLISRFVIRLQFDTYQWKSIVNSPINSY